MGRCITHPHGYSERCRSAEVAGAGGIFGGASLCSEWRYLGAFRLGRIIPAEEGAHRREPGACCWLARKEGQDLMVIPERWDIGGRVRAHPVSVLALGVHTVLLLQNWGRGQGAGSRRRAPSARSPFLRRKRIPS